MFHKKTDSSNKTIKNLLVLLIFISFSCIIFLFLIVNPAPIGISYDWSPPTSLNFFDKLPLNSSWVNNTQISPGNNYFVPLFYWFLLYLNISSAFVTIIFLIFVFSFSAFFIYLLFKKINLPSRLSLAAGLLYLTTSQLLLVTHHGYTSYLVSFCFVPLLIYFYLRYLEKPKFAVALAGAVVFSLAASQIQFFVINSIILLVFSCFFLRHWRSIIKLLLIFIVVNILLSASWLLVYLNDLNSIENLSKTLLEVSAANFQSNSIMDLFNIPFVLWSVKDYLQLLNINWFYNIWTIGQILIFSLPFLIYGFYRKKINSIHNKLFIAGFFLLAIGFLLSKGRAEPFSWTGDWFYNLPLAGMFRDLNHFYYLVTFSIIWLFALAVYIFYINIKKKKQYQRIFFLVLVVFILINAFPYFLNVYQSRIHQYEFEPGAYDSLTEKYNNDLNDFRLLWLPGSFYVKYNDGQELYSGRNPLINQVTKEDLPELGRVPGQPSLMSKVLEFGYCSKIKNCTERFLGLFNVRDIINLKQDFLSTAPLTENKNMFRNEDYWTPEFYDMWTRNLNNATKTDSSEYYDIFQLSNEQYLPHIYVPKELIWIDGQPINILDGIILTEENKAGYLVNDIFRSNVNKVIVPLEFSEDSGLKLSHNNNSQIFTKLNIPEDGNYHLVYYQKHRTTTSPGVIFTLKDLNLENKEFTLEKKDNSDNQLDRRNPLESGHIYLQKGEYKVTLSNTANNQNLVINPSFDIGSWSESYYDDASGKSDYDIKYSEEHGNYFQIHNKQRQVNQLVVVGDLDPHQKYLFSYDVQHLAGEKPVVCLMLDDHDYCHQGKEVADNNDWQHFEFVYEQGRFDRALINFYVPKSDNLSVNNFDNFDLRQVSLPETISFVKDRELADYQVAQVEYRKINNTKYRVILKSASGNIPLIFIENYSEHWKAYVKSESNIRLDDIQSNSDGTIQNNDLPTGNFWEFKNLNVIKNHQKINGYNNIWYYQVKDGPKDLEIIIEYKPQILFSIGQYVAIITLGLIIIFYIVNYFIKIAFKNKQ